MSQRLLPGAKPAKAATKLIAGFPSELIDLVLCSKDSGKLMLPEPRKPGNISAGVARCGKCGTVYEIRDGILRLLPEQRPLDPVTKSEQHARDRGAQQYDSHFSEWANAAELSTILKEISLSQGGTIADMACGTGRVTTHLLQRGCRVLAADLSEDSLRILAKKAAPEAKLGLIWSDATQLRFLPGSIDLAVSTQLLEHIPTRDQRAEFVEGVHAALKPEGTFVLTVYFYSALRRLLRRRQEGFHTSGVFYRRFTGKEIQREFSGCFRIAKLRSMQIDPRFLPASFRLPDWLMCSLEKTFLRDLLGQLLFVKASKIVAVAPVI